MLQYFVSDQAHYRLMQSNSELEKEGIFIICFVSA